MSLPHSSLRHMFSSSTVASRVCNCWQRSFMVLKATNSAQYDPKVSFSAFSMSFIVGRFVVRPEVTSVVSHSDRVASDTFCELPRRVLSLTLSRMRSLVVDTRLGNLYILSIQLRVRFGCAHADFGLPGVKRHVFPMPLRANICESRCITAE